MWVYNKAMTDDKHVKFSAVLTPNCSLTPRGFAILMGLISVVSFVTGIAFLRMGAWPVFGFFGLDVVLIYWAFKKNFADAQLRELIELIANELIIVRCLPKKPKQEIRFNRHWVRLNLVEDNARELIGKLTVRSHGKIVEIASFLGPDERKEFHALLKNALNSSV